MRLVHKLALGQMQRVGASGGPPARTVELQPSGPFWQDLAKTVPAAIGDPVWVYQGIGGDAVAPSSGQRPLRAAGGGVMFAAGTQLIIAQAYSGRALSMYARYQRVSTAAAEVLMTDSGNPENSYFYPDAAGASFGRVATGAGIAGPAWGTADVVGSLVYGTAPDVWFGVNASKTLAVEGGNTGGTGIRLGSYNGAGSFPCTGQLRAFAMSLVGHTNAEWLAMITYLASL